MLQRGIKETCERVFEAVGAVRPTAPEYKAFAKAWGWYKIIADMADTQILRFDSITALPVMQVLVFLRYCQDKRRAEEAQRKLDRFIAKNSKHANC